MNNRISGNGADTDDAATPGPTGINVFGLVSRLLTYAADSLRSSEMRCWDACSRSGRSIEEADWAEGG
jgi:hypothetical protein